MQIFQCQPDYHFDIESVLETEWTNRIYLSVVHPMVDFDREMESEFAHPSSLSIVASKDYR